MRCGPTPSPAGAHPYLVGTLAVEPLGEGTWLGVARGRLLIREPVRGDRLDHELAARGLLPVADAVAIGVQLAGALATLHRHRLVHGRAEPATVVVTNWVRSPKVKLGSVGAAQQSDGFGATPAGWRGWWRPRSPGMRRVHRVGQRAMRPRRWGYVPASLLEAMALLEADALDDRTVEPGRILQRAELEQGRVPTECTVAGPEPVGGHHRPAADRCRLEGGRPRWWGRHRFDDRRTVAGDRAHACRRTYRVVWRGRGAAGAVAGRSGARRGAPAAGGRAAERQGRLG
ncbi:MAG: hypothetical protein R2749_03545 [Acidimicrobiales bacterium]